MARVKQTIALEDLRDLGKRSLKEPNSTHYLCEDMCVVVATHHAFFLAVAPHTKRLNPSSVGLMGKELFQLSTREAQQFGESLSRAYSYCQTAGAKAKTGEKLTKEVYSVYMASCGKEVKDEIKTEAKRELKSEPGVARTSFKGAKLEPSTLGCKLEPSSPPPNKSLKRCLSSPSQIAALYGGHASTVSAKVMQLYIMGDTTNQDTYKSVS